MNKDLIVDGMIQYHHKNMPRFSEEEVTKLLAEHKHYEVGSSGIYIVKDYDKKYPYSNLFGNVITHSFESLKAIEKWNVESNGMIIYMQFAFTIGRIEGIEKDESLRKEEKK